MAIEQQTRVRRSFRVDEDGYDALDVLPGEVFDVDLDYGTNLLDDGVTISASTWTVPSGLTTVSDGNTTTTTTIRLSGQKKGRDYVLENKITTSDGEQKPRQLRIYCR